MIQLYLGIDFGTSGARAIAIDTKKQIHAIAKCSYDIRNPNSWEEALIGLIEQIPSEIRSEIVAIAIDGTSGTVLLCDDCGKPASQPMLYRDSCSPEVMNIVRQITPDPQVETPTSSFAKLLCLVRNAVASSYAYFLHQADWLGFLLHGRLGISDYHNALKLGYDPEHCCYPEWFYDRNPIVPLHNLVPEVFVPGTPAGKILPAVAAKLSLNPNCVVCAGTTDSNAAFFATGAHKPGEAMTSLGSTLVLKILSPHRIEDPRYGIYSHRFDLNGETLWLVGGASNTGGAVLRKFFSDRELVELSNCIDCTQISPLEYYPLLKTGERFPLNNPQLLPKLEPRPDDPVQFLHGLLESIAKIELQGYLLLQELGAPAIASIYTVGGGADNHTWTKIRARYLEVAIAKPQHIEAAYGTALLALQNSGV